MGEADLIHTALIGETNHLLITGASDCGKDNLAWWMLLSLALVLDGKGLDFQPWERGRICGCWQPRVSRSQ